MVGCRHDIAFSFGFGGWLRVVLKDRPLFREGGKPNQDRGSEERGGERRGGIK